MTGEAFLDKHALMKFNGLERTTCTSVFNWSHGYGGFCLSKRHGGGNQLTI